MEFHGIRETNSNWWKESDHIAHHGRGHEENGKKVNSDPEVPHMHV